MQIDGAETPDVIASIVETPLGEQADYWISTLSSISGLIASGIAVFLFITKRKKIKGFFHLLLSYAQQLSLGELTQKIDTLSNLNANEPDDLDEIEGTLHEVAGHIRGSSDLKKDLAPLLAEAEKLMKKGRLTEPRKRSFVSEARQRIRGMGVQNIDKLMGEKK